jgi:glycosyltransferase involved in cell wall biosynthesis
MPYFTPASEWSTQRVVRYSYRPKIDGLSVHVLIIPSWYPANPTDLNGCFFREQSLALKKHGHDVGIIDVKFRLPRSWRLLFNGFFGVSTEVDEGLVTYRVCGVDWFRHLPRLRRWLWLRRGKKIVDQYISENGKPDIIHAHAIFHGGELAKEISEKFIIPFVITEHSSGFARGHLSQEKLDGASIVSASAAKRLAVSHKLCQLLESQLSGSLTWQEMPNIVSQKFIEFEMSERQNQHKPFVFLAVAMLTENKGVHNLLTAYAEAFACDQDVILKIGGDGVERPRLERLAKKLGVAENVIFLGKLDRDQVLKEMSKASVFVLSSRYETFGIVVIEALALGKPVIATRCGGPESIVREKDGLLIPADDMRAFIKALKDMHTNFGGYDSVEIRAACLNRYSEAIIAKRLSTIYSKVTANYRERLD